MMILLTYWYYFALAVVVLAALVVMVSLYLRANMEAPECDLRGGIEGVHPKRSPGSSRSCEGISDLSRPAHYSPRDDPEAQQERRMHTRL